MYTAILLKKHEKRIARFSPVDQARVYKQLKALEIDPRPPGKKVKSFQGLPHGLRLRVGDIRVVYTVSDKEKLVYVVDIGRRSDIY